MKPHTDPFDNSAVWLIIGTGLAALVITLGVAAATILMIWSI